VPKDCLQLASLACRSTLRGQRRFIETFIDWPPSELLGRPGRAEREQIEETRAKPAAEEATSQ
jgi:hypothetical protein